MDFDNKITILFQGRDNLTHRFVKFVEHAGKDSKIEKNDISAAENYINFSDTPSVFILDIVKQINDFSRCLQWHVCVGRMNSQMSQVKEQRLGLVMAINCFSGFIGENISGIASIIFPRNIHISSKVIAPTSLKFFICNEIESRQSTSGHPS